VGLLLSVILSVLLMGCTTPYQSEMRRIMETKTEWQRANEGIAADYKAKKINEIQGFNRILGSGVNYSSYEYQRLLCSTTADVLDLALKGKVTPEFFKQVFLDSGELVKVGLFAQIPVQMKAYDYCMANGEPVQKVVCARLSRIWENFATGNLSRAEFDRQNAEYDAVRNV
jgi:hypothetical protein